MLYNLLKNLITNKYYKKEDMTNKLNVFLLYNQVTETQYAELIALVNPTPVEEHTDINNVENKTEEVVTQ